MTKEQFLSGTIFRTKSKNGRRPHTGTSTYYYDGTNLRWQSRSWTTGEVTYDSKGGDIIKIGRIGFNFTEMNQMRTKSRLNFEDLVEFVSN